MQVVEKDRVINASSKKKIAVNAGTNLNFKRSCGVRGSKPEYSLCCTIIDVVKRDDICWFIAWSSVGWVPMHHDRAICVV